jgi:hypothetical protein
MSITWTLAVVGTVCGRCDQRIAQGDPVLYFGGYGWRVARCVKCAGEPVPDAIEPPLPEPMAMGAKVAALMERVKKGATKDWKQIQAGEKP